MKLGVVFSYGISLKIWHEQGIAAREIAPYLELVKRNSKLSLVFFTYDLKAEINNFIIPGIEIVPMGQSFFLCPKILRIFYSLFLPFIFYRQMASCCILKSNQIWGSWVAVIGHFLARNKLWIRVGYEHYSNHLERRSGFFKRVASFLVSFIAYQRADLITVTTEEIKEFVAKVFFISSTKIRAHGNYINTDIFKPLNILKKKRVLYVGRLNFHKNIKNLMLACGDLNLPLTIVGQGEHKTELYDLSQKLNLDVHFIAAIENSKLPEFYSEHFIFCLPSLFEGNPKVLLEAMSCGAIVLGTKVKGIRDIIKNNENGLLCDTDWESIKKGLDFLINNQELAELWGLNARKKILKVHSFDSFINFEMENISRLQE